VAVRLTVVPTVAVGVLRDRCAAGAGASSGLWVFTGGAPRTVDCESGTVVEVTDVEPDVAGTLVWATMVVGDALLAA